LAIGFYDFDGIPARRRLAWALCACAALCPFFSARAQYPGQLTKPASKEPVLRAISVLEWTGDEGHPKASRLVPVAVFDGNELQDGGIYLSRPQPISLAGEVEYELQRNGKPFGLYDIRNSGLEQGSWVGYGAWKALLPAPKPKAGKPMLPLNPSWDDPDDRPVLHRKHHPDDPPAQSGSGKPAPATTPASSNDPDRPTLHKKDTGDTTADNSTTPPDPDRPTLHKKTDSSSSDSTTPPGTAPQNSNTAQDTASDPDRPTLHKKSDDAGSTDPDATPAPDPDRPTLRKPTTTDDAAAAKAKKKRRNQDTSGVEALSDFTDPDRPHLKRGKTAGSALDVLPSLLGLPPDLAQAVAVSDAHTTAEHPWSFDWANPEDRDKMKATLEQMARDALGLTPPPAPVAPAPQKHVAGRKAVKPAPQPVPPPPAPLADEDFRVYELAYGSGATMVLSAHTGGQGAADKYVTLIAQPDLYGNTVVLLKSTTDAAHLDDQPRMRLVDAVDALADNRGELLFELRGETQRQFALYRVLRGETQRIFATAPADIVTPTQSAN
jgi:hypothetical protein